MISPQTTLKSLKDSVIDCIEKYLRANFDEDAPRISKEIEFIHEGKAIGFINFVVCQEVLSPSYSGGYDEAPYSADVEQIIERISVKMDSEIESLSDFVSEQMNRALRMMSGDLINV